MEQDPGHYTNEGGRTWPNWETVFDPGGEVMLSVRTDSIAHAGSALHPGTIFRNKETGELYIFDYYSPVGDASQGGTVFKLKVERE